MLFMVRLTDKPDSAGLRKEKLKEHLAWLKENKALIPAAGSLREEEDGIPVGGAWIVEAERREDVESLVQTDPFCMAGLRENIQIYYWSLAWSNNDLPTES